MDRWIGTIKIADTHTTDFDDNAFDVILHTGIYIVETIRGFMKLKELVKQFKNDIPAVFIALTKKETPLLAKILTVGTVVYALSPIDLISDFIPIFGLLDDAIVVPMLIALVIKLIPPDVLAECRTQATDLWAYGTSKKWYFALLIVLVLFLLIFLIRKVIGL